MEANKIDELFKNGLQDLPSAPSPAAWGKLETMIQKKKKGVIFWYYGLAASIVLLLCSIYLIRLYGQNMLMRDEVSVKEDVGVQHKDQVPTEVKEEMVIEDYGMKESNLSPVKVQSVEDNPQKEVKQEMPLMAHQPKEIEPKKEENVLIERQVASNEEAGLLQDKLFVTVDTVSMPMDKNIAVNTNTPSSKRMPITIIYKRGTKKKSFLANENTMPKDSTKGSFFKSILDTKRGFANGDLFADIREAKANFFNNGIDFKNSKVKNSK